MGRSRVSDLTLVVVAKNSADLAQFDRTHVAGCELVLVANDSRTALSRIGNRYLASARTPVLGLVHADCWFGPGALAAFTATAMAGNVCGIVGVSLPDLVYQWSCRNPGSVSTLDSCSVFFRRDAWLRFDEVRFDSLHLHVEDLCLQAEERGIPVVVPAADANHRGSTSNGDIWLAEYRRYRERLCLKWAHRQFATT